MKGNYRKAQIAQIFNTWMVLSSYHGVGNCERVKEHKAKKNKQTNKQTNIPKHKTNQNTNHNRTSSEAISSKNVNCHPTSETGGMSP